MQILFVTIINNNGIAKNLRYRGSFWRYSQAHRIAVLRWLGYLHQKQYSIHQDSWGTRQEHRHPQINSAEEVYTNHEETQILWRSRSHQDCQEQEASKPGSESNQHSIQDGWW